MPTILSHPAVPLALGLGLGAAIVPRRLLAAGVAVCLLPDLDVIGYHLGLPYAAALGHRGFTHSLFFALALALCGTLAWRSLRAPPRTTFLFLFVAAVSHGLLDSLTTGGLGIAFFWPWSAERYFAPLQMIRVSPLSLSVFFSAGGAKVLLSELLWVWLPCAAAGLVIFSLRRQRAAEQGRRQIGVP